MAFTLADGKFYTVVSGLNTEASASI